MAPLGYELNNSWKVGKRYGTMLRPSLTTTSSRNACHEVVVHKAMEWFSHRFAQGRMTSRSHR